MPIMAGSAKLRISLGIGSLPMRLCCSSFETAELMIKTSFHCDYHAIITYENKTTNLREKA